MMLENWLLFGFGWFLWLCWLMVKYVLVLVDSVILLFRNVCVSYSLDVMLLW